MTSVQEFNCILCKETFENKEDLQIHFRKHGDPKFKSAKKTRPESEVQASVPKKNEAEMVSCDVCSEMFPTISKAITHKHKMHPDHDAKYFCPWCGKLFTMKHLYNKHLQTNHVDSEQSNDNQFHCDSCDVDFYMPTAMLYHNKFFHRQDTDLPSIGQSKKLKMCPQNTVIQIYFCPFCGEEYDNKVNLHKHVTDDHNDENQSPEDVLRCPLCDAIFYHLDAYELHLTFHTTEDLYSEKNEMFEQMTEFSLETVAPVMEKVENDKPQDGETELNTVGLDKFLELAMSNSLDGKHRMKSKKHKKHKKSKKSAITLDEFLNMNQDVFGEGLDFQGVEEVPTQVVKKRLKQARPSKASIKALESSNLEKLKRQGIIVKMNPSKAANSNLETRTLKQIPTSEVKPSTRIQTSSEEVLSKLISQSNNQIKIVKKSSVDAVQQNESDISIGPVANSDKRGQTPENIEVECDVNMPSEYTSSENEAIEEKDKVKVTAEENGQPPITKNDGLAKIDHIKCQTEDKDSEKGKDTDAGDEEDADAINDDERHTDDEKELDNLKNVQGVTQSPNSISEKPVSSTLPHGDKHDPLMVIGGSPNYIKDKTENNIETISKNSPEKRSTNSLNALKHLSHLITIKPVTPKNSSAPASPVQKCLDQQKAEGIESDDATDEKHHEETSDHEEDMIEPEKSSNKLEHLKRLSNNITIKSVTQSPKIVTNPLDEDEDETGHDKQPQNVPIINKVASPTGNSDSKPLLSPKITNKFQTVKPLPGAEKESTKPSNIDLLKHLTNVTAKPVIVKSNNPQTSNATISNIPSTVRKNVVQNLVKKKEPFDEIEIFNIDDSDDETDKVQQPLTKTSTIVAKVNTPEPVSAPVDKLKNISKQVTVKPINQPATSYRKENVQKPKPEDVLSKVQRSMAEFSDDDDENILTPKQVTSFQQKKEIKNDITNTLKNLSKHITVKSAIPSPNLSVQSGHNQEDLYDQTADSDSDTDKTGVKMTEITENNGISDDEMAEREDNVHEKGEAFSEGDTENFDNDDDDFEHQIEATTVKKCTPNITAQMLNLQNMNRNITIKSLSEKKGPVLKEVETVTKNKLPNNSALSIKPFRQCKTESQDSTECVDANRFQNSQVTPNRSIRQNIASCSQQNTVNKEVTVKTIQTKTVIQEITTTVTKTIKTVNQTVKQELQSVQSASRNNQTFQKVQGMKSTNQTRNYQGVAVRHPTPVSGPRIRGPVQRPPAGGVRPSNQLVPVRPSNQVFPIRPSNQIVPVRPSNQIVPVRPSNQIVPVRPANQLVPMRPGMNTARMSRPRMSGPMNTGPGSQQKTHKTPNPMNATKRTSEEPAGHFSCFKKPKESLIPVSEIPSFSSEQGGEAVVQYTSSQMSKSNFTSSTRTVKSGKIVTSTQMKSEMSASSQQLERLNSMSGLKIMKTSQMSQASKVEEKCDSSEVSASKRNTLEAIQKLQKQGLLVKKPRLETSNEDSDHSEEDNSYITEEPDDD